jgi:hypothetical protein
MPERKNGQKNLALPQNRADISAGLSEAEAIAFLGSQKLGFEAPPTCIYPLPRLVNLGKRQPTRA